MQHAICMQVSFDTDSFYFVPGNNLLLRFFVLFIILNFHYNMDSLNHKGEIFNLVVTSMCIDMLEKIIKSARRLCEINHYENNCASPEKIALQQYLLSKLEKLKYIYCYSQ